jgi:hypothetical protein
MVGSQREDDDGTIIIRRPVQIERQRKGPPGISKEGVVLHEAVIIPYEVAAERGQQARRREQEYQEIAEGAGTSMVA